VILRNTEPSEGAVRANETQRRFLEETRLGIPVIIHDECLHGCVAKYSTVFPQSIALAATWDVDLMYRVAKATARETRARGIRQCLSPVVNLSFDARAGRTEETYGEDPYLASKMAYAYVKALREEGIVATPKHYIMNFVGDGGRDSAEIHMSERFIRETELPVSGLQLRPVHCQSWRPTTQ
jgi:Beta-glucosidase-related glycosidases